MLSQRQAAKAQLVAVVQAHRVLVRLPVVVRAAVALQVVQAVVLDLAQAVQQVALVVEPPVEQAELLVVQVVRQAEPLVV